VLLAERLARIGVDGCETRTTRLAARIVECLEVFRAEDRLDGAEAVGREAQTVALGAEDDGGVALEDEEGDVGALEGAGEQQRGDACARDEDGLLRHRG
jgi:hypothetical protein